MEYIESMRGLLDVFREEIHQVVDQYMEKVLKNEKNAMDAPLILKLNIIYENWSTTNGLTDILCSILNEPLQAIQMIRATAWMHIFTFLSAKYPQTTIALQLQQVYVMIRMSGLPITQKFQFVPFRHVRLSLSVMKCVLYSFQDRCTLVRQSIWYCPKQCTGNEKHIINGEHPAESIRCSICNGHLNEYENHRSTYDCRWIQVFDSTSVEQPCNYGQIHRSVRVKLSDEMCDVDMVLGEIYILTGTYDIMTHTYIPWNFQKFQE